MNVNVRKIAANRIQTYRNGRQNKWREVQCNEVEKDLSISETTAMLTKRENEREELSMMISSGEERQRKMWIPPARREWKMSIKESKGAKNSSWLHLIGRNIWFFLCKSSAVTLDGWQRQFVGCLLILFFFSKISRQLDSLPWKSHTINFGAILGSSRVVREIDPKFPETFQGKSSFEILEILQIWKFMGINETLWELTGNLR